MSSKTCFLKKAPSKNFKICGTKLSLSNSQLLVSTGISALDYFLGGGLAVGSILLVEEDLHGVYSKLLLKYWLAEGVVSGHEIFLSSADSDPSDILQELPDPVTNDDSVIEMEKKSASIDSSNNREDLKIAWRYKHLNVSQASESRLQFGHSFDISKSIRSALLDSVKRTTFDPLQSNDCHASAGHSYSALLRSIQRTLTQGSFSTSCNTDHRNIMRIALHSVGSAQWSENDSELLCQFLYSLRAILRSSYAVCLITAPTHLFQPWYRERLKHLADGVIRLESFVGTKLEDDSTFKDYNGLFHFVKLPQLNSLAHCIVNTEDMAFKLRRKRFTIEKLHLPPALPDSDLKSSTQPVQLKQTSESPLTCGSQLNKIIDF